MSAAFEASTDPLNRYVRYPIARRLARPLVATPITANHVTYFHLAVGLVAAWFVTRGTRADLLVAAILYEVRLVLDCLDGVLARAKGSASTLGRAADELADTLNSLALFAAIYIHLRRTSPAAYDLPLVLVALAALAATAGAHTFYRRKFGSALRTGTDAARDEFLEKAAAIRSGRAGLATRLSYAIDRIQLAILAPGSSRDGASTADQMDRIRREATTPRFRRRMIAIGLASGDNVLFLLHVALAAGVPRPGLAVAAIYATLAVATAIVSSDLR